MNRGECTSCGGSKLESHLVSHAQVMEGKWIIIENLPALVCQQCGERYFIPEACDRVMSLLHGETAPKRIESVAVYDAALEVQNNSKRDIS